MIHSGQVLVDGNSRYAILELMNEIRLLEDYGTGSVRVGF